MTDTATVPTQDELDAAKAEPVRAIVPLSLPTDMKAVLQTLADAAHMPVSSYARQRLAEAIDFTLPDDINKRHSFGGDKEAAKAAQKEATKARNELIKKLLDAYRSNPEKFA